MEICIEKYIYLIVNCSVLFSSAECGYVICQFTKNGSFVVDYRHSPLILSSRYRLFFKTYLKNHIKIWNECELINSKLGSISGFDFRSSPQSGPLYPTPTSLSVSVLLSALSLQRRGEQLSPCTRGKEGTR